MNAKAYTAGQNTRAHINAGAVATKDAAVAGAVAIGSFFKGLFAGPQLEAAAPAPRKAAAKRPVRRTK